MTTDAVSPEELRNTIRSFDPKAIYNKLEGLAAGHIAANKLFGAMPYNPKRPEHDLTVVGLEPTPVSIDAVKGMLDLVYPDWEAVILAPLRQRTDLINELVNRIKIDRASFSLMLAHERLEDVALVMAVLLVVLSDHIPYRELVQVFHIVIGNMVRTLGIAGMDDVSAVDALRMVGHVHFSFPRTESTKRGGFDSKLIDDSNDLMRLELRQFPQKVLAVAAPGSVDKVFNLPAASLRRLPKELRNRHLKILIQPVTHGTAMMISGYVIPVAAVFSGSKAFCEFGRLTHVETLDDIHPLMDWIADTRHGRTLVPTHYHRNASIFKRASNLLHRSQG
jgi:hypothetical protein